MINYFGFSTHKTREQFASENAWIIPSEVNINAGAVKSLLVDTARLSAFES